MFGRQRRTYREFYKYIKKAGLSVKLRLSKICCYKILPARYFMSFLLRDCQDTIMLIISTARATAAARQ